MEEMVRIMSAQQYFEVYGRDAIGKQKADPQLVRKQLIDAFHKEIFGLVALRGKCRFTDIPAEGNPEALDMARKIIRDETKKWLKLIGMFEMYRETSGLLHPDDLALIPEDGNGEIGFDRDGELVMRGKPRVENMGINEDGITEG